MPVIRELEAGKACFSLALVYELKRQEPTGKSTTEHGCDLTFIALANYFNPLWPLQFHCPSWAWNYTYCSLITVKYQLRWDLFHSHYPSNVKKKVLHHHFEILRCYLCCRAPFSFDRFHPLRKRLCPILCQGYWSTIFCQQITISLPDDCCSSCYYDGCGNHSPSLMNCLYIALNLFVKLLPKLRLWL